jgi:short-subunit dehydrogenase
MVKQGFGHIVNTASLAGLVPVPSSISYVATKYGVVGISNALRVEGANYGVKVSVVCPGLIDTGMKAAKMINIDREKVLATSPKLLPAEDCARVIIKGVMRNKAIITVTPMAKILYLLHRLSPGFTRWLLRRIHTKAVREMRVEN